MQEEDEIKKRIRKRLSEATYYYLYCSVCAKYLCCVTRFQEFIVCWEHRNEPVKYKNSKNNPPPTPRNLH